MNNQGVTVDTSHCGDRTALDPIELGAKRSTQRDPLPKVGFDLRNDVAMFARRCQFHPSYEP